MPIFKTAADKHVSADALREFLSHQCNYVDKEVKGRRKADLWLMVNDKLIGAGPHNDKLIGAGMADIAPCQLVESRPIRHLKKKLKREWTKGASLMRRQLISAKIKKAFKQYTMDNCADRTIGEVRREIGNTVGMSLETGEARLFYDRQLKRWGRGKKRKSKRVPDPMEEWERRRMDWEHVLSCKISDAD